MWKNLKEKFYLLFLVIPFLGTIFFIINFRKSEVSPNSQEWGQFADYFNWITSILNTILLYSLTKIANNLQKTHLEKQLKFELYKDVISKLDDYIVKYISENSNENTKDGAKFYLVFIQNLADSAKQNFSGLIDNQNFDQLCNDLSEKTLNQYTTDTDENLEALILSLTNIKTALFQQAKIDSK